jgi:RNA polymerase sigma-70 factor (ECF subfamily)
MQTSDRVPEFVELLSQSSRRVYSYIRTLVPNQADAEDVFQETSKTLWEKFEQYEPGTDFCGWALSIAHFKVLQLREKGVRGPIPAGEKLDTLLDRAAELLRTSEDRRLHALANCLQKLPAKDRELIDARYSAGATTQHLAVELKRSTDAIYRSLRRIHQMLFDCIRQSLAEEERS